MTGVDKNRHYVVHRENAARIESTYGNVRVLVDCGDVHHQRARSIAQTYLREQLGGEWSLGPYLGLTYYKTDRYRSFRQYVAVRVGPRHMPYPA